jgi:cytochrome c biogenesis protein CcmG/thiol:disulfide interchange protein DsbE
VAVLAAGLLVAWAIDDGAEVAEVGSAAPDFTVDLIGGGTFSLSRHVAEDGRPLILNLWASWCVPCRDEMPALSEFASEHPEVALLGVAVEDAVADSEEFAAEIGVSYPLSLGDEEFRASYPSFGLPATYYVDGEGTIVEMINGIVDEEDLADLGS